MPAYKVDAGDSVFDGPETERWRRMREGDSLAQNLADAGLTVTADDPAKAAGDDPALDEIAAVIRATTTLVTNEPNPT